MVSRLRSTIRSTAIRIANYGKQEFHNSPHYLLLLSFPNRAGELSATVEIRPLSAGVL